MASSKGFSPILPPGNRRSFDTSKTFSALMSAAVEAEQDERWEQASEYFDAAATVCQDSKEFDRLVWRAGLCRDKLLEERSDSEL